MKAGAKCNMYCKCVGCKNTPGPETPAEHAHDTPGATTVRENITEAQSITSILEVVDVAGDGACLFRAIGELYMLFHGVQQQNVHTVLRQRVAQEAILEVVDVTGDGACLFRAIGALYMRFHGVEHPNSW